MLKKVRDFLREPVTYYAVLYSVIVMVIIMVMGGYIYNFYYHTIWNDFVDSNSEKLEAVIKQHEGDLKITDDIVNQLNLSKEITDFELEKQPLKAIKLEERLALYTSVSQFFDQVIYCYHGDDYVYNAATSAKLDRLLASEYVHDELSQEEFSDMLYDSTRGMKVISEQQVDGKFVDLYCKGTPTIVSYIKPIEPKNTSSVMFSVGSEYYDNLLSADISEQRSFFIFYGEELIVSRGAVSLKEEDYPKLLENSKPSKKIILNGEKFLCTVNSGNSGLYYVSLQSMDVFQGKILSDQWGIILLLVLCSVPTAFAIVWASRRIKARVSKFAQEINKYDRVKFVREFVKGNFTGESEVYATAVAANIELHPKFCIVLVGGEVARATEGIVSSILTHLEESQVACGYGFEMLHNNLSLLLLFGEDEDFIKEQVKVISRLAAAEDDSIIVARGHLHDNYSDAPKAYLEADAAYMKEIASRRQKLASIASVEKSENRKANNKAEVVGQAISYMNEKYSDVELNISALCDYLCVSPTFLSVEFKEQTGMSPSDYLSTIRMEKAKQLLKETDMKVKEVSLAVGYEDDHGFMRRFKKYTGVTTREYRNGVIVNEQEDCI